VKKAVFVATWTVGKPANEEALTAFEKSGNILDAVEQGLRQAEIDNHSVGLKGIPNAAGIVQLDACIMYGPGHKCGSVAALEVADRFRDLPIPFIAGGLIRTPDIVKRILASGCTAVSTTNVKLWEMNVPGRG
jgi:hypothetical protein